MFGKKSESRLCAFCKLPHRVYLKKEVSLFDAIILLMITGLLAVAIWGGLDLRSLLIFVSLTFSAQVFFRVRYRSSVKCPHCGFDPILYIQDNEAAAQKVKGFMEKRSDNPQFMLRPQPQITPLYRTREEIEQEEALLAGGEEEAPALKAPAPETTATPLSEAPF